MKRIAILITFIAVYSSSFAWIKATTTKSNGGLFGYSSVTEMFTKYFNKHCQFNLYCYDPGTSRCKFTTYTVENAESYGCQSIVTNVEESWWDMLNTDINSQIANGYNSGTMIRNDIQISHPETLSMESAVVVWTYSPSTDILEMTVYSYNEADELGII
ncbi:MAG TPA: hypothetical protein VEC12_11080 [Bacteroidia bacterium]|nr:hypothetical protein [Bacteroidia bacterium]